MPFGLSLMICLLSVGMLAGRVYEILYLTDSDSGFLITNGIALNPMLIALFIIIVICCAVIIFGKEKATDPFFSKSSAVLAGISGVVFIVCGIMSFSQQRSAAFIIAGGLALCLLGFTGLSSKAKDIISVLLLTVFVAGMCLDVIVFNVYSIHNTEFLCKVLSYASAALTIVAVLKNVYSPSVFSRALLYVCGYLCFVFCGMFSIADIVCFVASGETFEVETVKNIAFVLLGLFALDNSLSVMPKTVIKLNTAQTDCETEEPTETVIQEEKEQEKVEDIVPVQSETHIEEVFCETAENVQLLEKTEVKPIVKEKKKIFRSGQTTKKKTEKIVYKKPKE